MNRRLVYTVILGDYDRLREVKCISPGVDYICVTDNKDIVSNTWKLLYIDKAEDSVSINRLYKFLPMKFFDYEQSLYLDGNISIEGDMNAIFDRYLDGYEVSISPHPFRNCLYDEAKVCVTSGKAKKLDVDKQINKYYEEGFPKKVGFFENNVIVRAHSRAVEKLMLHWHSEFTAYSKRDQLSLCYCLWKNNIACNPLDDGPRYSSNYFNFQLHKKEENLNMIKRLSVLASIRQKQSFVYHYLNRLFSIVKSYKISETS